MNVRCKIYSNPKKCHWKICRSFFLLYTEECRLYIIFSIRSLQNGVWFSCLVFLHTAEKNISSQYISIGEEYQMLCQCRKIKSVNKADFTQLNIQISNDSEFFKLQRLYLFCFVILPFLNQKTLLFCGHFQFLKAIVERFLSIFYCQLKLQEILGYFVLHAKSFSVEYFIQFHEMRY